MFIHPVPEDEASPAVAAIYESERNALGFLPQYAGVFSHHPDAYAAWRQLISSIRGQMDVRRAELITLAAARTLRSSYCTTAHGKILAERFYDQRTVAALMDDHHAAGLDEVDAAVMDFAERVAKDPTSITAADVQALRELGLSERDILDTVLAVAARAFFATVVETFAAGPDPEMMAALEPALRDALLVGRRPE